MTHEQTRLAKRTRPRSRPYVALAAVILAILAAAGALSYYAEEVGLFLSLGGWNRSAAPRLTEEFITHFQAGRRKEAVALVSPEQYKAYSEGGKSVGLEHVSASGRGRYFLPFDTLIPAGQATLGPVEMSTADGGGFVVPVTFADGTKGWFVVGRAGKEYRIVGLPTIPGRFHY